MGKTRARHVPFRSSAGSRSKLLGAFSAAALVLALTFSGTASAAITPSADAPTVAGAATDSLVAGQLSGAAFTVIPPNGTPTATSDSSLAGFPSSGSSYAILTSGDASLADDPNDSGSTGVGNNGGDGGHGEGIYDLVTLRIDLAVPADANCLSMNFRFLSDEFPEFVGGGVNDAFVAELDSSNFSVDPAQNIVAPNNFAFDEDDNVISVNTAGFSDVNSAGTTYDGATAFLQASTPITPGAHSIYLSIFDQGDDIYDSAAFIDRFRLRALPPASCNAGATDDTTPPDTIIDSTPHGTTSDSTPTFDFHSTEENSTFECSIDTGTPSFGPCSGPGASHTPASALADGTYTFRVRATDQAGNTDLSPATETFTVGSAPGNNTPSADAGADQNVDSGDPVSLDGSGSTDPDGDPLTYGWTQTGGSSVTLSGANTATPTFTAPTGPATLTFELEVCDDAATPLCDTDTVTVEVNPPVVAGNDYAARVIVNNPTWASGNGTKMRGFVVKVTNLGTGPFTVTEDDIAAQVLVDGVPTGSIDIRQIDDRQAGQTGQVPLRLDPHRRRGRR